MIKKINTAELLIGMYICDLGVDWSDHPFFRSSFRVEDEQTVQKIASAGIQQVSIDTAKGGDVPRVDPEPESDIDRPAPASAESRRVDAVSGAVEIDRARGIFRESKNVVHNLMASARSGQVHVDQLYLPAEHIVQSAFRNPNALSGISRIKIKDEYTFMHCVGVSALLVSFGIEMEFPEQQLMDLAIGGLVHDIGKALVPQDILNKPGRLNDQEFETMKAHVTYSRELLLELPELPPSALDVAMLHHERMDGRGYPAGIPGEQIGLVGRMAAIVDVYDALTSVRVYKDAWEPTRAMKKLFEWSPQQFDVELVQRFIQCLGIYPVSTVVLLESQRIGIVIDQTDDLLHPVVRLVYDRRRQCFTRPRDVDMRQGEDRIVEAVNPEIYGIEHHDFL